MPKLIITGCGRSGTKYISHLLTAAGVKCYHEVFFGAHLARNNVYRKDVADVPAEASWLAVGAEKHIPVGTTVVHQTRNPVRVIRSMMGIKSFFRKTSYLAYLHRTLNDKLKAMDAIDACMEFWILWNKRAEDITGNRHRLEDIGVGRVVELCQAAGNPLSRSIAQSAIKKVKKNVNARNRDDAVSWAALPAGDRKDRLVAAAEHFGYSLKELESA